MSLGYVFHCTPCGKAHAGDCPTKTTIILDLKPTHQAAEAIKAIGAAVQKAVQTSKVLPAFPAIGSLWYAEVQSAPGMGWWRTAGTEVYVVRSCDLQTDTVSYYIQSSPTQTFHLDVKAWSQTGEEIKNSSARVRMVP